MNGSLETHLIQSFHTTCSISALNFTVLITGCNYYYHHQQQTGSADSSFKHKPFWVSSPGCVFCSGTTTGENPEPRQHEVGNRGSWKFNSMKSIRNKHERHEVPFPTFILILILFSESALKVNKLTCMRSLRSPCIFLPKHLEKKNKTRNLKPKTMPCTFIHSWLCKLQFVFYQDKTSWSRFLEFPVNFIIKIQRFKIDHDFTQKSKVVFVQGEPQLYALNSL